MYYQKTNNYNFNFRMIKDFSLIDLVLFYIPCDEFSALIEVVKFNLELNNIFYKMEFVTSYIQAKNVELSNIYLRCIIYNFSLNVTQKYEHFIAQMPLMDWSNR